MVGLHQLQGDADDLEPEPPVAGGFPRLPRGATCEAAARLLPAAAARFMNPGQPLRVGECRKGGTVLAHAKARSFVFDFLSRADRQPGDMTSYARHFSLVILNEVQLHTNDRHREEETRFRHGINIESAPAAVLVRGSPDQPVALPPDRETDPIGKYAVRCKFVLADTGVAKFRVQLDGDRRFGWLGSLIGRFRKRKLRAEEGRRQTGYLAAGISGKGDAYAAQPFKKARFRFRH